MGGGKKGGFPGPALEIPRAERTTTVEVGNRRPRGPAHTVHGPGCRGPPRPSEVQPSWRGARGGEHRSATLLPSRPSDAHRRTDCRLPPAHSSHTAGNPPKSSVRETSNQPPGSTAGCRVRRWVQSSPHPPHAGPRTPRLPPVRPFYPLAGRCWDPGPKCASPVPSKP